MGRAIVSNNGKHLVPESIEILLKNGAEINIRDNGKTPLDYAISNGNEEIIKALTEKTLLYDDGYDGNEGLLQMSLEQKVEIDSQDQYKSDLLYPLFF